MRLSTLFLAALAVLLTTHRSSADWVNYSGGESFWVPPGPGFTFADNLPVIGGPKAPITFTQPFTMGRTITGSYKAGAGAILGSALGAVTYAADFSASGIDTSGNGSPRFELTAGFQADLLPNSLHWYFQTFFSATGNLAPGDIVTYTQIGTLSPTDKGAVIGTLGGQIDTPGPFSINLASDVVDVGPLQGSENLAVEQFHVVIAKGTGGGTTTFQVDPGVSLFAPAAIAAVPEPSAFALSAVSLVGSVLCSWQRRRRAGGRTRSAHP